MEVTAYSYPIIYDLPRGQFFILAALAFLSFILMLAKEWRRKEKRYLVARILASLVLTVSVLMLIIQPALPQMVIPQKAILLSSNYNPLQLDSLRQSKDSSRIFSLNPDDKQYPFLPSLASLHWHYPAIQELVLLGDGLGLGDRKYLSSFNIQYLPSQLRPGILELRYPQKIYEDERFPIYGLLKTSPEVAKLVLENPGGAIDSLQIDAAESVRQFNLGAQSRESGRIKFRLSFKDSLNQTIGQQELGLWIAKKPALEIRILNSFPNFESKYLKTWLGEEGHRVAIRSQISRNRFKDEFLNGAQRNLTLGNASLEGLDLLILDVPWLENLSPQQWANIQKAVKKGGMGLLIQGGEALSQRALPYLGKTFFLAPALRKNTILMSQQSAIKQQARLDVLGLQFSNEDQLFPLIKGSQNEVLGAAQLWGLGQVAINLIPESYPLLLEDKQALYAELWTGIIQKIARKSFFNDQISSPMGITQVGRPMEIRINSHQSIPQLEVEGPEERYPLALRRAFFLKQSWTGKFWPKRPGWHLAQVPGDSQTVHPFMVYPDSSWKAMQQYQKQTATQLALQARPGLEGVKEGAPYYRYRKIPLWIYYLLALFSLGFLWLEEKL